MSVGSLLSSQSNGSVLSFQSNASILSSQSNSGLRVEQSDDVLPPWVAPAVSFAALVAAFAITHQVRRRTGPSTCQTLNRS
jgi:hypothetical protein